MTPSPKQKVFLEKWLARGWQRSQSAEDEYHVCVWVTSNMTGDATYMRCCPCGRTEQQVCVGGLSQAGWAHSPTCDVAEEASR